MRRTTFCNRDCPDTCRIVATVRDGRVVQLQGDKDHPVTRGFLCHRTNQFLHLQYGPTRLTRPLMRKGGKHQPVSWDEALDAVASRLRRIVDAYGPEAVLHYRSGGTLGLVVATASDLFFETLGPVTTKRGDICSGAGEAAQELDFGMSESSDPTDLDHARHVLLWGKNVATCSPHSLPRLKALRKRGGTVISIDPVRHAATARHADHNLQPRPAGDFALAMAVATELFDHGGIDPDAADYCRDLDRFEALVRSQRPEAWRAAADVPSEDVRRIADALRDGPTTIVVGWGMARRRNGGAIVRALDALGAISGNVGRPGACVSYYHQRRRAFSSPVTGAAARTIPEPMFGPALLAADPPVRALWVTAGNPVAMLPEADAVAEAIRRCELVVVADPFYTDTAKLADVVLPTPTLLEADDLLGAYGHHYLGASTPVVPSPDDVKSDLWIFQQLALRLGFGDTLSGSPDQWKRRLLGPALREAKVGPQRLEEGLRSPVGPEVVFAGRKFATDDGRARLLGELPRDALPPPRPAGFPLWLLSLSTPASQSSQWSRGAPSVLPVTVHPDATDIPDGGRGRLVSPLGALEVEVHHDPRQRRDVAVVPKGGLPSAGTCANSITRAALTDLGEGGALYDEAVRLEPA